MKKTEIRPMTERDVDPAVDVAARAFEVEFSSAEERTGWVHRLAHLLDTDPDGCFVAANNGEVIGVAQAIRRERLWNLSLLTVDPTRQSGGAGRQLLEAACQYMQPDDDGLIVASNDPRAIRIYGLAGFEVWPGMDAIGKVRPEALPPADPEIHEVPLEQIAELESFTRTVRGAPYTGELPQVLAWGVRIFALADRGFVAVRPGRTVWALSAIDEDSATRLLWHGLRVVGDCDWPPVRWITTQQQWAVRVALEAGLRLQPFGALCVRGTPGTLHPYLPSGPFA